MATSAARAHQPIQFSLPALTYAEDALAPIISAETLQLHQPSLDDVFLAKTGRKLEGAGDEQPEEQEARRGRRGRRRRGR